MARMTMADVRRMHAEAGGHFFSQGAMRFFRSRVESSLYVGGYFITSEQFDDDSPREYRVRHFYADDPRDIVTVGDCHASKDDAVRMIRALQADAKGV